MAEPGDNYLDTIRRGDAKGLREIYAKYLPRIARFIQMNGGSAEDAKDIFQEAIVRIYRKSKSQDFLITSQFYTFLYGVCRNLWGNQLQKKSRTEVSLTDGHAYEQIPETDTGGAKSEEDQLFWDAFALLGQDCQQLLQLFFAKVKMEEIVKRLGLSSVGYAKKKKFKCKEKLVALVKQDDRYLELKLS
jgi:RNA polymerase sigma factor (sigma-70 family)